MKNIVYKYDPQGNRIGKIVTKEGSPIYREHTWYVRDAQGNVISTYTAADTVSDANLQNLVINQTEKYIYGSSRLGVNTWYEPVDNSPYDMVNFNTWVYKRGWRQYELSNHLGNVLATINDKKNGVALPSSSLIDYYEPVVVAAQDYYPFGMLMPKRSNLGLAGYRFGFNGKESDNDVKGLGNQQDYGMRIYDPRLGRFLSVDPLTSSYPWNSPFGYAENDPVNYIDVDGMEQGNQTAQSRAPLVIPQIQLSNALAVDAKGRLYNPTQLLSDVPVNSGMYAPQVRRWLTAAEVKSMVPAGAQDVSIIGTNLYYVDANGHPIYRSLIKVEPPKTPITWIDRALLRMYLEKASVYENSFTQWNISIGAYEVITNDPSTLTDEYLSQVQKRLTSGTGTDRDKIYEAELRRRKQLYEINDKHNPGKPTGGAKASVLPANHQQLWEERSFYDAEKDTWWTKEGSGKKAVYHRFSGDKNGAYHWSGSTGENVNRKGHKVDPVAEQHVPTELKRTK